MHPAESIRHADLGPHIAAYTAHTPRGPVAVVNTRCDQDPALRDQAACRLLHAGYDGTAIFGALSYGVRS